MILNTSQIRCFNRKDSEMFLRAQQMFICVAKTKLDFYPLHVSCVDLEFGETIAATTILYT